MKAEVVWTLMMLRTLSIVYKQAHDLILGSQPWKGTVWRERKGSQCSGARRTTLYGRKPSMLPIALEALLLGEGKAYRETSASHAIDIDSSRDASTHSSQAVNLLQLI